MSGFIIAFVEILVEQVGYLFHKSRSCIDSASNRNFRVAPGELRKAGGSLKGLIMRIERNLCHSLISPLFPLSFYEGNTYPIENSLILQALFEGSCQKSNSRNFDIWFILLDSS